jgi:antitoxin FitA
MASITIRNLDEDIKRRLRIRAAEHGHSMEEEVRDVLRQSVGPAEGPGKQTLWQAIREIVEPMGGFELSIPAREPPREPPSFDD